MAKTARVRDSVLDENLRLWKLHPEKICINCKSFMVKEEGDSYGKNPSGDTFSMYCDIGKWKLDGSSSEKEYRNSLLKARKCPDIKLRKPCLPGEIK